MEMTSPLAPTRGPVVGGFGRRRILAPINLLLSRALN